MFRKHIQHVAALLLLYLCSTEKSFPRFLFLHFFFFASVSCIIQFNTLLPLPFLPPFLPSMSSDTLLLILSSSSFSSSLPFLFISLSFLSPPFLFISLFLPLHTPFLILLLLPFPFIIIPFPFPFFPSLRLYRHWPSSRVRVRGREERVLVLFSLTAYSQGFCLLLFIPVYFHARFHLFSFLYTPIFFSVHTH